MWVVILLTSGKHLHDGIFSLRVKVWAHKSTLALPLFIKVPVPVPSQYSDRPFICLIRYRFCIFLRFWFLILKLLKKCGISFGGHFTPLRNRPGKTHQWIALFCLFLKLVQINSIFSYNVCNIVCISKEGRICWLLTKDHNSKRETSWLIILANLIVISYKIQKKMMVFVGDQTKMFEDTKRGIE